MTLFLYNLQNSTPGEPSSQLYAPPSTTRPSEVFSESLPKVQTLSDHCDGDIKDEVEGDPAAAPVDGGHVHRRR